MYIRLVAVLFAITLVAGSAGQLATSTGQRTNTVKPELAAFFFWFLSVGTASCSLLSGVCTMTMTNGGTNSSYDLALTTHDCQLGLIYAHNGNTTWYNTFTGVAGGQVTSGLPFGTTVTATCSVPLGSLAHEPNGWVGDGNFQMQLVNNLSSVPRGTTAWVHFGGTWTRPASFSLTTGSLTYTGRLNMTSGCSPPCLWVNYRSHVNYTLQTWPWMVVKNALGQTVFVSSGGGPVGPYWDTQYGFSLGLIPSGSYKAFLFVTTSDMVAISTTTELDITVP